MCLILFARKAHARYPLVIAANRDEWFHRPTAPAAFWPDQSTIFAGRDLEQHGTWLGINRLGHVAGVTNFREPGQQKPAAPSRGALVSDYLKGSGKHDDFWSDLHARAETFNGFNLFGGSIDTLTYYSNRGGHPEQVAPGVHGLSNHLLNSDWPKVTAGTTRLRALLDNNHFSTDALFDLLTDRTLAPESALPATGVPLPWERALSSAFITPNARAVENGVERFYGTRCSTVIRVDTAGQVEFLERTFAIDGSVASTVNERFTLS